MQSIPFPSAEVTSVLDDLRRIVRVLRESSREAEARLGVSGAQLFVLRALSGAGSSSLNALAARTHTHQSTVSVVVKRLVEHGLVESTVSERDARRIELQLTSKGRGVLARAPRAGQDRLIDGIEGLSRSERRTLASALHRLVETMGLLDHEPEMFFEEAEPAARAKKKQGQRRGTT